MSAFMSQIHGHKITVYTIHDLHNQIKKGYSEVPALQHHTMKAYGRTEGIKVVIQHKTEMCVHLQFSITTE